MKSFRRKAKAASIKWSLSSSTPIKRNNNNRIEIPQRQPFGSVNRLISLLSPGSPYSINNGSKPDFLGWLQTEKEERWDTRSMTSDVDEDDEGMDRYTSVFQSPVKKLKSNSNRTPSGGGRGGYSDSYSASYSDREQEHYLVNPLHRQPPRYQVLMQTSSEQHRSRDAVAVADIDATNYFLQRPTTTVKIKKPTQPQPNSNSNSNSNRDNNASNRVTWVVPKNKSRFSLKKEAQAQVPAQAQEPAPATQVLANNVSNAITLSPNKSRFVLRSPIRKSRKESLFDGEGDDMSPTSTQTDGSGPTKYVYTFESASHEDDEDITFHTQDSSVNLARECEDLHGMYRTALLLNAIRYACMNYNTAIDSALSDLRMYTYLFHFLSIVSKVPSNVQYAGASKIK